MGNDWVLVDDGMIWSGLARQIHDFLPLLSSWLNQEAHISKILKIWVLLGAQ